MIIWSAGLRLRHIALFLSAGLIILVAVFPLLPPYQRLRVETFLAPDTNSDAYYNINQALISIGSGGVLGKGYYVGSQNTGRFLRVRHTDFIFSVIAHEFGMVGGLALLGMFAIVLTRILKGAREASDPLGSMICFRRGRHDLLSGDGIYRHESEPSAGDGSHAALCQLGRDVAAIHHGGHRSGSECHCAA